jgi:hypothetical protein
VTRLHLKGELTLTDRRGRPWGGSPYFLVRSELLTRSADAEAPEVALRVLRSQTRGQRVKVTDRAKDFTYPARKTVHRGLGVNARWVWVNADLERRLWERAHAVFDGGFSWWIDVPSAPVQLRRDRDGMLVGILMPLYVPAPWLLDPIDKCH